MTFTRTPSGLANQRIFYRKRFVIYIEEEPGIDPGRSVDTSFWRSFFAQKFHPNLFEYKPLGGKAHVINMAKMIIAKGIPNCLCAMDRDYDDLFGEMIDDHRVFYTFGYGVENDLFDFPALRQIVRSVIPGAPDTEAVADDIVAAIETSIRLDRVAVLSDQVAAARDASTLDRDRPQSNLDVSKLPLRFRRDRAFARLLSCRNYSKRRVASGRLRASRRHLPCHVYFELVYHTTSLAIRNITDVKLSKDQFRSIAVATLMVSFGLAMSAECIAYYDTLAQRDLAAFSSLPHTA